MSLALVSSVKGALTGWNPYDPAKLKDKGEGLIPVAIEESEVRLSAARIVIVFFVCFLVWAVYAPLDAGVVLTGTVTVAGSHKTVQHGGGGIVDEINVHEGSRVKQGDVLIRVNPLNSEANLTSAELQYINLLATESRLLAERNGMGIRWSTDLDKFKRQDPRVAEAKQLQARIFASRKTELESQQRILREQLQGLEAQIKGLVKANAEKRSQMQLMAQESKNIVQLAKEGYVSESSANQALRAQSSLEVELANMAAEIQKTNSQIAATQLQIIQQRTSFLKEVDAQLSEAQKNREAYFSRLQSVSFDRSLTEVRAPVAGAVIGLKVNTIGAVISPGSVLMEIVPDEGALMVEAQTPPTSINNVHPGLACDLRFSAFNQNTTPVVPGLVKLVSADKVTGPNGSEFYLTQVEVTSEGKKLLGENKIQPGMPVEVLVKTGERSFMNYIIKPLRDRISRSFKEN